MEFDILENQEKCWARLIKLASSGKTGNAYLFTGPPGSGKEGLSILFAQYLNCSNPKKSPVEIVHPVTDLKTYSMRDCIFYSHFQRQQKEQRTRTQLAKFIAK